METGPALTSTSGGDTDLSRVGVTGHQRLPGAAAEFVAYRLSQLLSEPRNTQVVCSLAAGTDQLVAEWVVAKGGSLHVIVPCIGYETTFERIEDRDRYETLLHLADRVDILAHDQPSERAYWDAGKNVVNHADWVFAVWDGAPARGLGGTADVVKYCRDQGKRCQVVWPAGVRRD